MSCLAFEICAQKALVYKRLVKEEEKRREEIHESMKRANVEIDLMIAEMGAKYELLTA